MAVSLYLDVHVPLAIAQQLRRRGVDAVHATEKGTQTLEDDPLLELATRRSRVVFTQDIGFRVMAEDWQRQGKYFGSLFYGHQLGAAIGQWVADRELIARASAPDECSNTVHHLPL